MREARKGDSNALTVRFPPSILRLLDKWRYERGSKTREQAIKALVEQALATGPIRRRTSRKSAAIAAELAGKEIDRRSDPSADAAERGRRKRRLLEGPTEFRRARRDARK